MVIITKITSVKVFPLEPINIMVAKDFFFKNLFKIYKKIYKKYSYSYFILIKE